MQYLLYIVIVNYITYYTEERIDMNEHEIRKQIIFNVSQYDHDLIKKEAKKRGMSMRTWIIYSMANEIKRNQEEIK